MQLLVLSQLLHQRLLIVLLCTLQSQAAVQLTHLSTMYTSIPASTLGVFMCIYLLVVDFEQQSAVELFDGSVLKLQHLQSAL